jgi:putative transposase
VGIAKEYNAMIVLEDLNKLKSRASDSRKHNKKLSLWAYRRMQSYIHYKALMEETPAAYINPKGTSRTSPLGGRLAFINYRWIKLPNGHTVTRDIVASWNPALKGLKLLTRDVGQYSF